MGRLPQSVSLKSMAYWKGFRVYVAMQHQGNIQNQLDPTEKTSSLKQMRMWSRTVCIPSFAVVKEMKLEDHQKPKLVVRQCNQAWLIIHGGKAVVTNSC